MGKAPDHLTGRQFQEAEGTEDWRVVAGGAVAWFPVPSHSVAARLVRAVTGLPQLPDGALPDTDLRAGGIRVRLSRTGEGRFSEATVDLARAISAAARDLGLSARPDVVQTLQLAFDALDHRAVMPFWQTVLGYERLGDEVLADPTRRHPPIWFQQQAEPRPLRNRLHLDVVTSQPVATATLDAVRRTARSVAEHGYYATVADAEGNEVDVLPLPEGADSWGDPATEDWRLVFAAVAVYPVNGTAQAVDLAERVAELADAAGLPLGVDLRPGLVTVDTGKDRWEMDDGYRPLAARVQEAARELGLHADTTRPRFVQVGIDAVDIPAVRGFWRAVLGYEEDPRDGVTDIVDPLGIGMPLFLQNLDADDTARRAQRNRIHVDLFVPADQAEARVAAALAAGGRITYDAEAPYWVTVADPEGNEVDIAVAVGREEHWAEE